MSDTFLNMLKIKSDKIQAELAAKQAKANKPIAKVTDPAIVQWLDPKGSLQQAGLMVQVPPDQSPVVDTSKDATRGPVNDMPSEVRFNPKRNRIDLFFPGKPSEDLRSNLKAWNWMFDRELLSWFHFDAEVNRQFIRDTFKLQVDPKDSGLIPAPLANYQAPVMPDPVVEDIGPIGAEIPDDTDNNNYNRYKEQIKELVTELRVDFADLQLLAIDSLHKLTFGRN